MRPHLFTLALAFALFVTWSAAAQESAGTHKGKEHRITPDANQKKGARSITPDANQKKGARTITLDANHKKGARAITPDYTRHKKGSGKTGTVTPMDKLTHQATGKRIK